MKALVVNGKLSLRDMPEPCPGPGEALIRVRLAGICGTDREILKGYSDFRGILGHEFVGMVVKAEEKSWLGRRVVGEINVVCGECSWCAQGLKRHCPRRTVMGIVKRDGAFAEYVALPLRNLHEVPAEIPDEAAVFVEPLAAAAEILEQVPLKPGARAAVLGDGRLGLLVAQVLKQAGAQVTLIGKHGWKLDLARSWGVKCPGQGEEALAPRSFPVVVDATGSPGGFEGALRLVEPRGTLVMKSTFHERASFDTAKLVVDEITLLGSRCGSFPAALRLLRDGDVTTQGLVSKVFPLGNGMEAFQYLENPACLKVLLQNSA